MKGATHLPAGVIAGLLTIPLSMGSESVISVGIMPIAGAIGGLFPDIDQPCSKIGRKVKPFSVVVNFLFGHRGLTHNLGIWILAFVSWLCLTDKVSGICSDMFLAFILGAFSHLLLDALTPHGIPTFGGKQIHLAKIRTGSFMELIIRIVLWVIAILLALNII